MAEEDAVGSLSPMHWFVLILIVVLLFGSRKLPDAARAVGRSLRILKAETAGLREDDDRREDAAHRDERRYREERPRDAYPQDRYHDYRGHSDRGYQNPGHQDAGFQDRDYRDRDYRDRDDRDRDGYQLASGEDRTPREHPMEPRAVEGPPMNPTAGGARADSRTPDTQPR